MKLKDTSKAQHSLSAIIVTILIDMDGRTLTYRELCWEGTNEEVLLDVKIRGIEAGLVASDVHDVSQRVRKLVRAGKAGAP